MAANEPPPTLGAPPNPHAVRDFVIGLGIGLIPLVLFWFALSVATSAHGNPASPAEGYGFNLACGSGVLYLLLLMAMIFMLVDGERRHVALGMLTAAAASPVIAFLGCTVIPSLLRPGP